MKRIYFLTLILPLMLLTSGCHKEESSDCFVEKVSCYVNGEYWEDCCDNCESVFGGRGHTDCAHRMRSSNIIFHAGNNCNSHRNGLVHLGSASLNGNGQLEYNSTWYVESANPCERSKYFLDTTKINYVNIDSYDEDSRIVEGRFEYSAQDDCGKLVKITKGQFRLKYHLP